MPPRCSLIIPVYKNEENLADLLAALVGLAAQRSDMEVVFVVDGSPDRCGDLLREKLPAMPFESQLIMLSRNFGSFSAIRAGLERARGEFMAVMAADLQEPPELAARFFRALAEGDCDVVVGRRTGRHDSRVNRVLSGLYWKLYRRFIVPDIPDGGVDVFGCNRQVAKEILALRESNSSLVAQIFWVGYHRLVMPYERRRREKGRSAWTLRKKISYFLDSIFSFSDLPVMLFLWLGFFGVAISFMVAMLTFIAKLSGKIEVGGFATVIVLMSFGFSVILLSQGLMGSYLWRCFENTKQRPQSLVRRSESFDGLGKGRKMDNGQAP